MSASAVCRVCLTGIIKLNYLEDNLLINLYEKLSETKFNSEDARPKALCCLCYQKLLGCHTFSQMAVRSENIFSQLFYKGLEATAEVFTELLGMKHHLSSATTQLSMEDTVNESSVTFIDVQKSVNEELMIEEDPLMKVESISPEIESSCHQKQLTRPHVYRNKIKYIRKKPDTVPVSEATFKEAQKLMKDGKSQRAAAAAVGISEACLRYRLKRGSVSYSLGRFKPTFNKEQERDFAKHCRDIHNRFFGVTINNLRKLAYEYADTNEIENRFDKSSKMAGRDWVDGFLERNPQLTVRRSVPTKLARTNGLNKFHVERFYKKLKAMYVNKKFTPSRIYNMDEISIDGAQKRIKKVATKGKTVVGNASAERGAISVICCMSACGQYVPPAFIYPVGTPSDLLDDVTADSFAMASDFGYANTEVFLKWLHHFKVFANPTLENPVLLLLDNHSSHVSLDAVDFARENSIVMLAIPSDASYKLQPLERSLFSPLKMNYFIECDKLMSGNPGKPITHRHVAGLFNKAYKEVATVENAESGFKLTGIWPFNDGLFDETEFAPSTDQVVQNDGKQETRNQIQDYNMPETSDQGNIEDIAVHTELKLGMKQHFSPTKQLTEHDTIKEQISVKEELNIEEDPNEDW